MKDLGQWTRKEFEALPRREWAEDVGQFDSLVIIPGKRLHDSGFRVMDFIAVKDNTPFIRLSGCSDVIRIDGIGGYGYRWSGSGKGVPIAIPPKGWCIDCLKVSGLLRIFSNEKLVAGAAISSFDLYCVAKQISG